MTFQNLRLGKCWKLFRATLSMENEIDDDDDIRRGLRSWRENRKLSSVLFYGDERVLVL